MGCELRSKAKEIALAIRYFGGLDVWKLYSLQHLHTIK